MDLTVLQICISYLLVPLQEDRMCIITSCARERVPRIRMVNRSLSQAEVDRTFDLQNAMKNQCENGKRFVTHSP